MIIPGLRVSRDTSLAHLIASILTLYLSEIFARVSPVTMVYFTICGAFFLSGFAVILAMSVSSDGMEDLSSIDPDCGCPTAISQFSEKYEASPSESSLYAVIILDSS